MKYKIPLFDLNFDDKEEKAIIKTLRSKWISTGPKCEKFEKQFSKELGISFSLATSSCTSALHLAIKILDINFGDEVIVPSLSFVATVNAITYQGAKPVFCDVVGFDNLTIDPEDIRKKITSKTKAIIVMHYAGFPCKMDEIMKIAEAFGLKVIEDCAHSPLSEYKGKKLGTYGHVGCFSFFSNKNICLGEGGMMITNDEILFNRARLLRSHGMTSMSFQRSTGHATDYDVISIGFNYRLDDIRASIGIEQLKKLKKDILKREQIRHSYIDKLITLDNKLVIPFLESKEMSSNYIFPIVLLDSNSKNRDSIRELLKKCGIQTSVHYPAIHLFTCYKELSTTLPKTEYISQNEITLPFYSKLTVRQIDYIFNCINRII